MLSKNSTHQGRTSRHTVSDHPVLARHVIQNVYVSDFLTTKAQQLSVICRQLKKKTGRVWAAFNTNGAVKITKTESQLARTIRDIAYLEDLFAAGDEDL